jgi:signal transduction histidine kinase
MAVAAGLITMFVWFARRSDRVMLWFGITCLSWALGSIIRFWLRWTDLPPQMLAVLAAYTTFGLVVPSVILCLRTVGIKRARLEAVLWTYLIIAISYPLWTDITNVVVRNAWDIVNAALLLIGVTILLYAAPRPLRWSTKIAAAALLTMAVLMFDELARIFEWVDIDSIVVRQFHVPVMLIAIGAAIYERHVHAVWRIEQSNVELERRVNEKALEIQAFHAERQEVLRQQALTNERHRIIADMHDGLGASLVELLRYVQSTPADSRGIEQRVKEALQEMRIAIDALEPAQGDLATVLGNLRYRLEPLMLAGGIRLIWNVVELPKVEALDPSAVFAIQRAVLEALFNALKHSGAREIRLAALPKDDGIEIRIEDDGRGFDTNQPAVGLGLGTMRERTHRLGGSFEISSRPGAGTAVTIRIPYALANAPDERHRIRIRIDSDGDSKPTSLATVTT